MRREEIDALAVKYIDECDGVGDDGRGCFNEWVLEHNLADWLQAAYTAGLERAAEIVEAEIGKYEHSPLVVRCGQQVALRRAVAKICPEKHQD